MSLIANPANILSKPKFRGFDIEEPWLIPHYKRNLPHLRLQEATYFVTFRLADSILLAVAKKWQEERKQWQLEHGLIPELHQTNFQQWYKAYQSIPLLERMEFEQKLRKQYFVELDKCHGNCILRTNHHSVASALEFFHGQRIWLGDYVVMPNHVHLIVQPLSGVKLEEWLGGIKRFTSREIIKISGSQFNSKYEKRYLWQHESYDRIIRDNDELRRIRKYIFNNPANLRPGTFSLKQMDWLDEYAAYPTIARKPP